MSQLKRIGFRSATQGFEAGTDTPSAYLERCLQTLDRLEPDVGAFVTLDIAGARDQAARATERWRAGKPLSAIDGMPLGIKDIIETVDMPTQMGSDLYEGWRSKRDAASVHALREAGAVILGKTVTTEFAAPPPRGTRNPHDLARTPGGSSSGSAAAVAAGMIPAALGTQGIGSILRPASYCGCVGFKPTFGAVHRGGSHDGLSQSTHGVLAATLEDAWSVLREIVDRIGGDLGCVGLLGPASVPAARKPTRLAVLRTAGWDAADTAAKRGLAAHLERLRGEGVTLLDASSDPAVERFERGLERALPTSLKINTWEMRWPLNSYRNRDAAKISPLLLARLADAEAMTLADYRALLVERERVRELWQALAGTVDAAVTLAAPSVAPVGLQSSGDPVFAVPSSFLGTPAVSLPLMTVGGLPVGFQAMGFKDGDADLIGRARWLTGILPEIAN